MNIDIIDQGADYWHARYYYSSNGSIIPDEKIDIFLKSIRQYFTEKKILNNICENISSKLMKNETSLIKDSCWQGIFEKIYAEGGLANCFVDNPVTVNSKYMYIMFPEFHLNPLKKFSIRIRINPCLASVSQITKIYTISSCKGFLLNDEVISFFKTGQKIAELITETISHEYETALKRYLNTNESILPDSKCEFLSFKIVGTSNADAIQFIEKAGDCNNDVLRSFCKLNHTANSVAKLLNCIVDLYGKKLNSKDFHWIVQQVGSEEGYFGYNQSGDVNFVGITSGRPDKITRYLNQRIIENTFFKQPIQKPGKSIASQCSINP